MEKYRKDYAAYYERCKHANSPAMRDPNPTVVLIPGLGMIAWGKDKSESRVTAEFYNCAVEVMRGAEAIDEYIALPQQEAFDIEYWLLEEAKLKRMPAEKELARQVIIVIGAGSGIGKETAHRLVKEGAHIVCVDLNADAAEATAKEITDKYGMGIGVAGTGISGLRPGHRPGGEHHRPRQHPRDARSGRARLRRLRLNLRHRRHLRAERHHRPHPRRQMGAHFQHQRHRQLSRRRRSCEDVEGTGTARQPRPHHQRQRRRRQERQRRLRHFQGRREPSRARTRHRAFARWCASTASRPRPSCKGSAMFPRDRVIGSLAKYNIPYTDDEATESLVNKLAQFYADRTLTKAPITPADQAEAYFLLVTKRLSKTTGQVITVDGGLHEAFLR